MARRKPTAPALLCWDDVDDAMRQIIEQDNKLAGLQAQLDDEIENRKKFYEAEAKPLQDHIKVLDAQIKQFVTGHQDDLGDKKTKCLLHGKTGFRKSTSCVIPKGAETEVVAKLEELGLTDCIKVTKKVIRDQLKAKQVDVIEQAGARLDVKDTFWYEVDHASLEAPTD